MATQDDYIRTALRVPPELHAQIHASAKANNRTFNAEIVARLSDSFKTYSDSEAHIQGTASVDAQTDAAADAFAEKVAKRLNNKIPLDTAVLDRYMEILEQSSRERQRNWWIKEFGYDPEAPRVPQHGGAPTLSPNAKQRKPK